MRNIIKRLFENITLTGAKTTLIGILLMGFSVYGIVFVKETPIEDERYYMKIMYTAGVIGILLCLVPDNFINLIFEMLQKWAQNKIDKNTIIITMLAVGILGCKTTKPIIITQTKDSLVYRETVRFDTIRIRPDTAQITIDITDHFFKEKMDTSIIKKRGRATVVTQISRGKIISTAYCDSAERVIASLNIVIERYRKENSELREAVKKNWWYWWILGGFILGVATIIGIKRLI